MYIYVYVRTYKGIKKIMRNSARLNRNGLNLQDRLKVDYLLGDKRKNAIMSDYVQNGPLKQLFRVRIKILRSRRSIFPFGLFYVFLWSGFLICFCVVCSVFVWKCIALSCECILLSVFNRDFITPFTSLCRVFIRF